MKVSNAVSTDASTVIVLLIAPSGIVPSLRPFLSFCLGLELGQRLLPEAVEAVAQGADRFGIDPVDASRAVELRADQAGFLQDLQVLGNGGTTDGQLARELPDGHRTAGEPLEDQPAGGVTERVQCHRVSVHLP